MTQRVVPPQRPIPEDLISLPEMVDLFGVKRVTVDQWRFRRRMADNSEFPFPDPDGFIGGTPIWWVDRVLAWGKLTGRPTHEKVWRTKRASGGYQRKAPNAKTSSTST